MLVHETAPARRTIFLVRGRYRRTRSGGLCSTVVCTPSCMSETSGPAEYGMGASLSGWNGVGGGIGVCEIVVPASASSLAAVRKWLRSWLEELGWPTEAAQDIVLAVNEAITNVVEHAYPSRRGGSSAGDVGEVGAGDGAALIEVRAAVEPVGEPRSANGDRHATVLGVRAVAGLRRVRAWVRDRGVWRPDEHDGSDLLRTRGRGLAVMRALVDSMVVTSGAAGTKVELISRPAPGL